MSNWYVLDSDHAVRGPFDVADPTVSAYYARGIEARRVAVDTVDKFEVSTVFLCLDHSRGRNRPILFETMIFDTSAPDHDWSKLATGEETTSDGSRWLDLWCDRYCTWDEAKAGHERVVAALLAGKTPNEIEATS